VVKAPDRDHELSIARGSQILRLHTPLRSVGTTIVRSHALRRMDVIGYR
jgi:hypothetical protein